MTQHIYDSVKVSVAWALTLVAGITLDRVAVTLAIVYSLLQITSFFYPWHKKLWKTFGFKE